jgi:hypothetical protein
MDISPTLDPKGLIFREIEVTLVPSKFPFQTELSSEEKMRSLTVGWLCGVKLLREFLNSVEGFRQIPHVSCLPQCPHSSAVSSTVFPECPFP